MIKNLRFLNLPRSRYYNYFIFFFIAVAYLFFFYFAQKVEQKNQEVDFLDNKTYLRFLGELRENKSLDTIFWGTNTKFLGSVNNSFNKILNRYPDLKIINFYENLKKVNNEINEEIVDPRGLFSPKHQSGLIVVPKGLTRHDLNYIFDNLSNHLYLLGNSYTNIELDKISKKIQLFLFPIVFLVGALIFFIFSRRPSEILIFYLPSVMSCSVPLGLTFLLFGHLTILTNIIPLICFVLNLALGIHLKAEMKDSDYLQVLKIKMVPLLLTILTTPVGFGSLFFSEFTSISQFGVISFWSIILSSLLTISFQYLCFSFINNKTNFKKREYKKEFLILKKIFENLVFSKKNYGDFVCAVLLIIPFILLYFSYSKVNSVTDANSFFSKNSKLKKSLDFFERFEIYPPVMEIRLKRDKEKRVFKEFKGFLKLENDLDINFASENLSVNFNSFGKEISYINHNILFPNDNLKFSLLKSFPSSRWSFDPIFYASKNNLESIFLGEETYRIFLNSPLIGDNDFFQVVDLVESKLKKHVLEVDRDYTFGGIIYHLRLAQNSLIFELVRSFSITLLIVLLITYIYYKNLRFVLILGVINVLPVMTLYFLYWIFGISLHVGTVMCFSLVLGMVVDSSFHIFHHHLRGELFKPMVPILQVTVVLVLSFLSFSLFPFSPIQDLGISLGIGLFLGLIYDFMVLPVLLKKFIINSPKERNFENYYIG